MPAALASRLGRQLFGCAAAFALAGCPGPRRPTPGVAVPELTLEVGRAGSTIRGVAADRQQTYVALAETAATAVRRTAIEARPLEGGDVVWRTVIGADGGPLVRTPSLVVASLSAGEPSVRGTPGALVTGLDPVAGTIQWTVAFGATDWTVITALAATADDRTIVGGMFSGTLRVGAQVVTSGGNSDGFVCALDRGGRVQWLVRLGGPGPDAVLGIATANQRIAIAGTFTAGADLQGQALPAFDERLPFSDGFVAELDASGKRVWATAFGGKGEDTVAGIAIDSQGRVVVATTARGTLKLDGVDHEAVGAADGLVAWFTATGTPGPVQQLGGADADGLRAITAVGDLVVVGGFYAGTMELGDTTLAAGGGDGAFLAALDPDGVSQVWDLAGQGREEVAALTTIPGTDSFIAAVAHTADLTLAPTTLPAPADPLTGVALIVRSLR